MSEYVIHGPSLLRITISIFSKEGKHFRLWEKMGAHVIEHEGKKVCSFLSGRRMRRRFVWKGVQLLEPGQPSRRPGGMSLVSGEGFVPGLKPGTLYKYAIHQKDGKRRWENAIRIPGWMRHRRRPLLWWWIAAMTGPTADGWKQGKSRATNARCRSTNAASGQLAEDEDGNSYSYRRMAEELVPYLKETGFPRMWKFMPHGPSIFRFPGAIRWSVFCSVIHVWWTGRSEIPHRQTAWGRHQGHHGLGYPRIFRRYSCHQRVRWNASVNTKIFVTLFHPSWNSYIFNYSRYRVRFLIQLCPCTVRLLEYHADGLRVDAVASMLSTSTIPGRKEWLPNDFGGIWEPQSHWAAEDDERAVFEDAPGCVTIAEKARPGRRWADQPRWRIRFDYKWMMGWMHDSLHATVASPSTEIPPEQTTDLQHLVFLQWTFSMAFRMTRWFYGKGSLWNKMSGDEWHKFANYRLLFSIHPSR